MDGFAISRKSVNSEPMIQVKEFITNVVDIWEDEGRFISS